ncbi:hypothetical protein JGH11_18220 [Dysgonomonas sp. Marseille-P4677]|uniref:VPS10 domain-containing protein n=1 Tax=Dysgonomonas sp. Marseille-P4677 TaxID=2364790 RepID=UPI001913AA2E|nr:YCF48-related protein [Dysgonomonas sp. Marseille-P4677]MBK5722811.1 hypothetical protein [Dysgonomonas sp. Marseille-P4677]
MKNYILLVIILFPVLIFGQKDYRARLPIYGGFEEVGISPSERILIATKAGNIYKSNNIDSLWHLGSFGSLDPYSMGLGQLFERISVFTEDILMISGHMSGNDMPYNFVYRSEDGGQRWDKVVFGKGSWIDCAYVSNDGKAWMSGSSQLIYYTEDYGKTWHEFDKVEKMGNLRFIAVHFAPDGQHGLFGSTWNVLYKTQDNCKTWEKIETPLNQKKVKWVTTNRNDQPRINKVRVLKDKYLVKQFGKVFYSKTDVINWIPIKNALDFEITESGNIYVVNKDLTVSLLDSNLVEQWKSENKIEFPNALCVKNNSLFAINHNSLYKINDKEFIQNGIFTQDVKIPEPENTVLWKGEKIGISGRDILQYDNQKKSWFRSFVLHQELTGLSVYDNKLLTSKKLDVYYIIDLNNKTVEPYSLPFKLINDPHVTVQSFVIESGSQGCFHNQMATEKYEKVGAMYKKVRDGKNTSLNLFPEKSSSLINDIFNRVNDLAPQYISIKDLNLEQKDITKYKKDIQSRIDKKEEGWDYIDLKTFPGEDTDYSFYMNIVDSINNLPDSVMTKIFDFHFRGWSTTTDWIKLSLNLSNDETIVISNDNYLPNYYYSPWIITYKNFRTKCVSIKLGELIDSLSEGKVFEKQFKDKSYALYQIADYLYWELLKEE